MCIYYISYIYSIYKCDIKCNLAPNNVKNDHLRTYGKNIYILLDTGHHAFGKTSPEKGWFTLGSVSRTGMNDPNSAAA